MNVSSSSACACAYHIGSYQSAEGLSTPHRTSRSRSMNAIDSKSGAGIGNRGTMRMFMNVDYILFLPMGKRVALTLPCQPFSQVLRPLKHRRVRLLTPGRWAR